MFVTLAEAVLPPTKSLWFELTDTAPCSETSTVTTLPFQRFQPTIVSTPPELVLAPMASCFPAVSSVFAGTVLNDVVLPCRA